MVTLCFLRNQFPSAFSWCCTNAFYDGDGPILYNLNKKTMPARHPTHSV